MTVVADFWLMMWMQWAELNKTHVSIATIYEGYDAVVFVMENGGKKGKSLLW